MRIGELLLRFRWNGSHVCRVLGNSFYVVVLGLIVFREHTSFSIYSSLPLADIFLFVFLLFSCLYPPCPSSLCCILFHALSSVSRFLGFAFCPIFICFFFKFSFVQSQFNYLKKHLGSPHPPPPNKKNKRTNFK